MKTALLVAFLFSTCMASACSKVSLPAGPGPKNSASTTAINKNLLLQLVNDARKQGRKCGDDTFPPARPLTWNDQLEQAALVHSTDMYTKKYFSHTAPDGSRTPDRIQQAGYTWKMYGENIGLGYQSEKEVVDGWLNSPGHCKNIMNPGFKEMGIAKVGNYWTQVFGSK